MLVYKRAKTSIDRSISALLADDRLYFPGDTYAGGTTNNWMPSNKIHWFDLDTSFPVDGPVSDDIVHSSSSLDAKTVEYGGLWTDASQKMLYLANNVSKDHVIAYNSEADSWVNLPVDGGSTDISDFANALLLSSSDGGGSKNFAAGGFGTGMNVLDTTKQYSPTWTNLTSNTPYLWSATSQYVRFGKQGTIISVGGNESTSTLRDMTNIQIFDIESQTWSQIHADGADIPKPRTQFRSVISAAADDSSFQMTIYGGTNDDLKIAFADVYVLTMPAFQWIKIDDKGNTDGSVLPSRGRVRHHCHAYHDRQMIVAGGNFWNGTYKLGDVACNDTYASLKVLDTTTYEWQSQFPASGHGSYRVPKVVSDVVDGGPDGWAKPANSWGHTGRNLDIFGRTVPKYDSNKASDGNVNSSSNSDSDQSVEALQDKTESKKLGTEVIAGVATAGAVALIVCGTLTIFCLSKRRSHKKMQRTGTFHKPELSTESNWIPVANSRPTNKVLEAEGDSPEILGPQFRREIGWENNMKYELEARSRGETDSSDARPRSTFF